MEFFYDIEVKQLILPKGDWEVVFNLGTKDEFSDDNVVYFAVCDLKARPVQGETPPEDEDVIGIILPILFTEDVGLSPQILSYWKRPQEQEVQLRPKEK